MSYVIEQKIGKNIYLYEVTAYWDHEKKQSRQKRIYLGKKDLQSGKPVTPNKSIAPQTVKDFGHVYLAQQLAKQSGLEEIIEKVYGPQSDELLALAYFLLLEGKAFYLQKTWAEGQYLPAQASITSQKISKILQALGSGSGERYSFFETWAKKQKAKKGLFLDITSFSSYSKGIDFVEWGYNRDGESLPQINFGVLQGYPLGVPILYQVYPGSIADVSTLRNLVDQLKAMKVKVHALIMDRGFYSMSNLRKMMELKWKFVIPLPFSVKTATSFMSQHKHALSSPMNAFSCQGRSLFHISDKITISGETFYAHLYLDEKRRADEVDRLILRLDDLESAVAHQEFYRKQDVEDFMHNKMKWSPKLYTITMLENGRVKLKRKRNAISRWMNRFGKMILLTNDPSLAREDILLLYRQKDNVEKLFDILKNEMNGSRLHVNSREAMEGRLFLLFLALILYASLSCRMKNSGLFRKYTVSQIVMELKKLRVVQMSSGANYLTEVSKKQRLIFQALDIPLPIIPRY